MRELIECILCLIILVVVLTILVFILFRCFRGKCRHCGKWFAYEIRNIFYEGNIGSCSETDFSTTYHICDECILIQDGKL